MADDGVPGVGGGSTTVDGTDDDDGVGVLDGVGLKARTSLEREETDIGPRIGRPVYDSIANEMKKAETEPADLAKAIFGPNATEEQEEQVMTFVQTGWGFDSNPNFKSVSELPDGEPKVWLDGKVVGVYVAGEGENGTLYVDSSLPEPQQGTVFGELITKVIWGEIKGGNAGITETPPDGLYDRLLKFFLGKSAPVKVETPGTVEVEDPVQETPPGRITLSGGAISNNVVDVQVEFEVKGARKATLPSVKVTQTPDGETEIQIDGIPQNLAEDNNSHLGYVNILVEQDAVPDLKLRFQITPDGIKYYNGLNHNHAAHNPDQQSWLSSETTESVENGNITVNLTQAGVDRLRRSGKDGRLINTGNDGRSDADVAARLMNGTETSADWVNIVLNAGDGDTVIMAGLESSAKDYMNLASQFQVDAGVSPLGSDSGNLSADITNYLSQQIGRLQVLAQAERALTYGVLRGAQAGWSPEVLNQRLLAAFNSGGAQFKNVDEVAAYIDTAKTNLMKSFASVMTDASRRLGQLQSAEEKQAVINKLELAVSVGLAVGGAMRLASTGMKALASFKKVPQPLPQGVEGPANLGRNIDGMGTWTAVANGVTNQAQWTNVGIKGDKLTSSTGQTYGELVATANSLAPNSAADAGRGLISNNPLASESPEFQAAQRELYVAIMDFVNPGGGKEELALPEDVIVVEVSDDNGGRDEAWRRAWEEIHKEPNTDQYLYSINYDRYEIEEGTEYSAGVYGARMTVTRMYTGGLFVGMDRQHEDLGRHRWLW
ncbi:MAG: hypothetical protein AAF801_09535 [Pseudomonadota bacterium]